VALAARFAGLGVSRDLAPGPVPRAGSAKTPLDCASDPEFDAGMSYCVAAIVDEGLAFVSDSRTNAGVDKLGTYSKMHRFFGDGERMFVLLSAGNLATTQGVIKNVERDIKSGTQPNLATVADLEEAAECVGLASVEEQKKYRGPTENFVPEASFILGGQIRDQAPGIFMIYPQGNFVRSSAAAPYLQIGETKYGKPILDRIITHETSLRDALKCALVSMDSTMRSNATVGPPIELLIYEVDSFSKGLHYELGEDHPYLIALRDGWSERINAAFKALPDLPDLSSPLASVTRIDR
jgi:putative proteasome-type protease